MTFITSQRSRLTVILWWMNKKTSNLKIKIETKKTNRIEKLI